MGLSKLLENKKALFLLEKIPDSYRNYMTHEQAEKSFESGTLPFQTDLGSGSSWIDYGYYEIKMTFKEWINKYKITLL